MKSKVRKPAPSAWLAIAFSSGRIGGYAGHFEFIQKTIGAGSKPARMSRLEGDAAIKSFSQYGKKRASDPGIERQARRQLHEQAAEARAELREVREEHLEQRRATREPVVMRYRARNLDGKPEPARYARGPSLEGRASMRPIKGGIDLHSGKNPRITREV